MKIRRAAFLFLFAIGFCANPAGAAETWTTQERAVLRSLWIGSLPGLPPDPGNDVADDARAADFGHRLFFDTRLSANGKVACATCHDPARAFTDGRKVSHGIAATTRNAPTIIGAAYSPWLFWDGRKDSLWAQALAPFENPGEHGMTRARVVDLVRRDTDYRRRYKQLFGPLPAPADAAAATRAFSNLGKAIAAYERKLVPGPARFDRYVAAVLDNRAPAPADDFSLDEAAGLRVFIADNLGQCVRCHNGPLFTNSHFHNIGADAPPLDTGDQGRLDGIRAVLADEFNCLGKISGAPATACAELRFARRHGEDLRGAFKTPGLRNVAQTAPYMHKGQLESLDDVMWHYRDRPHASIGETELESLTITGAGFAQLEAFLRTLDSPVAAPAKYLRPPVASAP